MSRNLLVPYFEWAKAITKETSQKLKQSKSDAAAFDHIWSDLSDTSQIDSKISELCA